MTLSFALFLPLTHHVYLLFCCHFHFNVNTAHFVITIYYRMQHTHTHIHKIAASEKGKKRRRNNSNEYRAWDFIKIDKHFWFWGLKLAFFHCMNGNTHLQGDSIVANNKFSDWIQLDWTLKFQLKIFLQMFHWTSKNVS